MARVECDLERFEEWLRKNTDLGDRSLQDIVSRLRRLRRLVDPVAAKSDADLAKALSAKKQFRAMSLSVKSQLKRAGYLYRAYAKSACLASE